MDSGFLYSWPFGYFFLGGSPTLIWPWEGRNYPSRPCNGRDRPKGSKLKKKIRFQKRPTLIFWLFLGVKTHPFKNSGNTNIRIHDMAWRERLLDNRNFWDVSHPKKEWRGQVPPSPSHLAFDAIARFFHTIYTSFSEAIHLIFFGLSCKRVRLVGKNVFIFWNVT